MVVEDERENRLRRGGKLRPKIKRPGTIERKGKIPVTMPITVRALSEARGYAMTRNNTKNSSGKSAS